MPRGTDVSIPFHPRISADVRRAAQHHLEWPLSFGLLTTDSASQRHSQANYPELAARLHPTAAGDELDLAVNEMSWFFIFDDYFDGTCGEPDAAPEMIAAVTAVLDRPLIAPVQPIALAFADLWRRSREGMSPAWQIRTAHHWRTCFTAHLREAANRRDGRPPGMHEYLTIRRATIGIQPVLDLAERIGRLEVSPRAFTGHHLTAMRHLATDIVLIHNDICSVEKEQAIGDMNNIVLIIEHENSCSQHDAVEAACAILREHIERYLEIEHGLSRANWDLVPTADDQAALEHYRDEILRPLIRGAYDWTEHTGRYDQADASDAHRNSAPRCAPDVRPFPITAQSSAN
jgi:pentalenene synthase